jgi:hypothetical protein
MRQRPLPALPPVWLPTAADADASANANADAVQTTLDLLYCR